MVPRALHPEPRAIHLALRPPGQHVIALTADEPRYAPGAKRHISPSGADSPLAGIAALHGAACGTMVDSLLRGNDGWRAE